MPHVEWCYLMYTMKEKDNMKWYLDQIKRIAAYK